MPTNAAGVIATVAATGYGSNGWLTAYPTGQAMPATSTLNFGFGYAIANGAVLGLGPGGQVCVGVGTPNAAPGFAQVIVDVLGYLMP
jgi:hypothetical protein